MNNRERIIVSILMLSVAVLNIVDIATDLMEGVTWWHVSVEAIIAIAALMVFFYLLRGNLSLRRSLRQSTNESQAIHKEMEKWKQVSKNYVEGLSKEIDRQLTRWELTEAEKDVAFLILKGFTNKEIAAIRGKSEKTVRTQANAIYSKSSLSGRSQLAAFFLEDLLIPPQ